MKQKRSVLYCSIFLLLIYSFSLLAAPEVHVKEGEMVRLKITATDPDEDKLIYSFPEPFNTQGEWQTTYGNAGEYDVEVLVSDGQNNVIKHVRVIVDKRNRPPLQTKNDITLTEGETIDLKQFVQDPDNDPLTFAFPSPFTKSGTWKTSSGDEGYKVLSFTYADEEYTNTAKVAITILHANQAPVIETFFDEKTITEIPEGQETSYFVNAHDPDNDPLTYLWQLDNKTISKEKSFNYAFSYTSAGEHPLRLEISDGKEIIQHQWTLLVKDSNRPPVINPITLNINEGEVATLKLPPLDEDGDSLSYTLPTPFTDNGKWQTKYGDAGVHTFPITVSDGKQSVSSKITIVVGKINRPPQFSTPAKIYLNEGEKWVWNIDVSDSDQDPITLKAENLPSGATLSSSQKQLTWQPSYDYIQRRGGVISNILNTLRLEKHLLKEKQTPFTLYACDPQQQCSNTTITIIVQNVDRAPTLLPLSSVTVQETQTVKITPAAIDPDNDIIHFFLTPPVGKHDGTWNTKYGDRGQYTTYVTASDGQIPTTQPVSITVLKNNRPPTIQLKNDDVIVNENQQFQLNINALDPDNDNVTLILENPPAGSSFLNGIFLWTPSYESVSNKTDKTLNDLASNSEFLNKKINSEQAVVWLKFKASDNQAQTIHPVKITIKNINRPPIIQSSSPDLIATAKVNQPVLFTIIASDEDNDPLSYQWNFGLTDSTIEGTNRIERIFTSPGTKKVSVKVSDGRDTVEQTWEVNLVEEDSTTPLTIVPPPAPQPQPIGNEKYNIYIVNQKE